MANGIGLAGSEEALQASLQAALQGLETGIGGGVGALEGFAAPGRSAVGVQSALSGAMGPVAQERAFANFRTSPGQAFLRKEAEQALLRNASAIGGLGGGNVRRALQEQATGLAAQDFGNAFNRLGSLSSLGASAAGGQADLLGRGGLAAADLSRGVGRDLASGRTRAGEILADQSMSTASALSNLTGGTAGNIANLLTGLGTAQAGSFEQLAALLANIGAGQGTQVTGLPALPGIQETEGIIENLGKGASGVGALLAL